MQEIIILGGRGIGMITSMVIDDINNRINNRIRMYKLLGFLNDEIEVGEKVGRYKQIEVIGKSEDIKKYSKNEDINFFVAYLGMLNKQPIYDKIKNLGINRNRFNTFVHPTAYIPNEYCEVGNGCLFAPLSHLSPDTKVGDHCFLLPNSFVGHDSTLEDFVSVANNATVGGNVLVKKGVHVGSNATIRENVTIGEFSMIGMGSVVLEDVPPYSTVVGNPTKIKNKKS